MKQAGETKEVALASLQPHPENYRHHPDDQVRRIAASLGKHGQYRTVVVQASTNRILAGHGVVAAARQRGEKTILATVVDCSDEEALAILVDDNELSRHAEDDPEELTRLLTSLEEQDVYTETWENGRELEDLIAGLTYPRMEGEGEEQERRSLAERFGVPPFSVLDARQGYWQERKRGWLALGIRSELGRGGGAAHDCGAGDGARPELLSLAPGGSPRPACDYSRRQRGDGTGRPL